MRRSASVFAPILASAALTTVTGCAEQKPCVIEQTCAPSFGQTVFGGFGESFVHHPEIYIFGIFVAGVMRYGVGG